MKIKEPRPVEVVVEVVCDCCSQSTTKDPENGVHEYATLSADWGHYSKHDNESYRYQLCETCFFEVISYLRERSRSLGIFDDKPANSPLDRLKGSVTWFDRPTEPVWPDLDDED